MLVDLGAEVHACGSGKCSRITYGPAKEYYYDLSEKEALDQLLDALPKNIDALFICQGISMGVNPDLKVMKVNFLSVKYLVEALTLRIADNGSITIISSSGGFGWEQTFGRSKEIIDCGSYEATVEWFEKIYEDIATVERNMDEIQTRLDNIRQQKISSDNVYQFLLYFDLLYDKFTDSEKKEFLQSFVERVDVFPEEQPGGRFLKRIKFRFLVFFEGAEVENMRWDNEATVESVVTLVKAE